MPCPVKNRDNPKKYRKTKQNLIISKITSFVVDGGGRGGSLLRIPVEIKG